MSFRSSRSFTSLLFIVAGIVGACSLQVPNEKDVFSDSVAKGGRKSGGAAGRAGGVSDLGGSENGGTGPSTNGGSSTGGVGTEGGATGQGGASGGGGAGAGNGSVAGGGNAGFGGTNGVGGAPAQGGNPLTIGLIAQFHFEDAGSTTIAANTAPAADPPVGNATYYNVTGQAGVQGNAVEMRNDNTSLPCYVELPKAIFSGLTATTISVWVYDRTTTRKGTVAYEFSSGHSAHLFFTPDKANVLTGLAGAQLAGEANGASFVNLWYSGVVMTNSTWHHTLVTWDADAIKFYVDGVLTGTQPTPGVLPKDLDVRGPNLLGRTYALVSDPDNPVYTDSPPRAYMRLDELKIYNRVLPESEIASLYTIL